MKKYIIAIAIGTLSGVAIAQQSNMNDARSSRYIGETTGVTNYHGIATVNINTTAANVSNESWRIIKTVTDASGNVVSIQMAYNTNYVDDRALTRNAWTNRASATYK